MSGVQASQLGTMGSSWTQTQFDSFIQGTLIPEAERFVDSYCNHSFGTPTLGTLTLDGNGKEVLFLPPKYCPMLGIGAGSINSVAITASSIHCHDQYLEYHDNTFTEGCRNIVLYGSYGYVTMPKDIEFVTAQLCANILADIVRRKMAPDLFANILASAGPQSYQSQFSTLFAMPDVFSPNLKQMLEPYKITWLDVG